MSAFRVVCWLAVVTALTAAASLGSADDNEVGDVEVEIEVDVEVIGESIYYFTL